MKLLRRLADDQQFGIMNLPPLAAHEEQPQKKKSRGGKRHWDWEQAEGSSRKNKNK